MCALRQLSAFEISGVKLLAQVAPSSEPHQLAHHAPSQVEPVISVHRPALPQAGNCPGQVQDGVGGGDDGREGLGGDDGEGEGGGGEGGCEGEGDEGVNGDGGGGGGGLAGDGGGGKGNGGGGLGKGGGGEGPNLVMVVRAAAARARARAARDLRSARDLLACLFVWSQDCTFIVMYKLRTLTRIN